MRSLITTSLDFAGGARPDIEHFYQERLTDARVGAFGSMPGPPWLPKLPLVRYLCGLRRGAAPRIACWSNRDWCRALDQQLQNRRKRNSNRTFKEGETI